MRSLLFVVAIVALSLVPMAWVERQRQRVLMARDEAIRAVILAERAGRRASDSAQDSPVPEPADSSTGSPPEAVSRQSAPGIDPRSELIERLQKENAELRDTVERLRREVPQQKAGNRR
jgi:hypothetical protein